VLWSVGLIDRGQKAVFEPHSDYYSVKPGGGGTGPRNSLDPYLVSPYAGKYSRTRL
jgi:hypothetical protein